jgi:glycosyltransferase involved in cell wall biosynthesis
MDKVRILHITASVDPQKGGVSQAIRTIIFGLENYGVSNSILCLDPPSAEFVDWQVTALGSKHNPWSYNSALIPWLKEHLHEYQVVIVHGLWLYHSYASIKTVKDLKKVHAPKIFIMPHGMLDPYFQKASGRKLKALRNLIFWNFVESRVVNNADGLLFTCQEEKELARQTFAGYKPKKEIVVGLGVENPPPYHEEMQTALLKVCPQLKDQPFLLFLSRIHEKKGVDLLINAYAKVYECSHEQNYPNASLEPNKIPKLMIAGPGFNTDYGRKIQKLIFEKPFLKENVYLPGMLSGDAKWAAFYHCDALVLPSHQENFGIAVAEALACNKPVLISNQVNIWREVKELNGGIISADTLEGTIELLRSWESMSTGERAEMGINGGKVFKQNFSIDLTSKKFLEAINLNLFSDAQSGHI